MEHYQRANALFEQRQFAEANAALEAALKEDPNLIPALTLRGKLAMGLNQFDVARESFEKAAHLEPKSAYTQFLLGFFHYVDNDFEKALGPLHAALQLKPNDARTHLYIALNFEGLARPQDAIVHYEKALAIDSTPDTHVAYGRLLFSLGRFDDAQKQIERALVLDVKSRDAHYEQGRLYFEEGKFAEAAAEGERAMSLPGVGTTDRQIHFLLGRAYRKLGNSEAAEQHLKAFRDSGVSLRR
jgi:tetratricopeptide (TPR) repeat protein